MASDTKNGILVTVVVFAFAATVTAARLNLFPPLVMLILLYGTAVALALMRWPSPEGRQATITLSILAAIFLTLLGGLIALGLKLFPRK